MHSKKKAHHPAGFWITSILMLCVAPALWYWHRQTGKVFFAISADDYHRALLAWDVHQGNLLPSPFWPPLQFWLNGLVLHVYPHLLSVPYLIITTVTIPWVVWLSSSALVEPLYFAAVALAYWMTLVWQQTQQRRWVWLAGLSLAAAGMCRFDAWGHAIPFSIAVGGMALLRRQRVSLVDSGAAMLPWIFPIFWFAYQFKLTGDAFSGIQTTTSVNTFLK